MLIDYTNAAVLFYCFIKKNIQRKALYTVKYYIYLTHQKLIKNQMHYKVQTFLYTSTQYFDLVIICIWKNSNAYLAKNQHIYTFRCVFFNCYCKPSDHFI